MEMVRKKGEEEKKKKKKKKREIPEEIIVEEIMWRLPVKPLVCFRSVCKTWNSIIASDPKFAILQLKNSSTCFDHRLRVMLWDSLEDSSAFFLENSSKNHPLTSSNNNSEFAIKKINTSPIKVEDLSRCSIVAACDGLVCVLHRVTNSIFFWNPLTGETKRVSDPPGGIPPFKYKPAFGLGYDSSTDDYKLVLVNLRYHDIVQFFPNGVRVFSLRTNSWRQIQDIPITIFSPVPGVFTNGALYWTGYSVGLQGRGCHPKVASFCLEKENYRLLDIPLTDVRVPSFRFGVQALGDKLAVYYESKVDGSYRLLLNDPCENSESWTKHTLILPNYGWFTPLCLLENVEDVLFKATGNQFGVYSFRDGTFRHLQIIGLPKIFSAITFSESLISPNTFKGRRIDIKSMAIEEEEGTRKGKI